MPRPLRNLWLVAFCLLPLSSGTPPHPQTPVTAPSLTPSPKPPDVFLEWKQFVGIYDYTAYNTPKQTMIFLEQDQRLYMQPQSHPEKREEIHENDGRVLINGADGRTYVYSEHRAANGNVTDFSYLGALFTRTDAGADPGAFYHITPSKPIDQLRDAALAAQPPRETGPFHTPDLVELVILDTAFHLDIRYAKSDNFLSTPVYSQARAFLQRPAAEALVRVLHKLGPLGYGLLIHDAYRPWYVTKIFWDATPAEGRMFVADPKKGSRHNRGCAVDLTLYDLATKRSIEMPGLYDEMSPRSFPNFPGGISLQRWHRDLLRTAMESEGFTVNEDEWWHFDYRDWKSYAILNVPFEKLSPQR